MVKWVFSSQFVVVQRAIHQNKIYMKKIKGLQIKHVRVALKGLKGEGQIKSKKIVDAKWLFWWAFHSIFILYILMQVFNSYNQKVFTSQLIEFQFVWEEVLALNLEH